MNDKRKDLPLGLPNPVRMTPTIETWAQLLFGILIAVLCGLLLWEMM